MDTNNFKTIALYARVSTDKNAGDPRRQDEAKQPAELRETCKRQSWKIQKEYIDRVSGGTTDRKAFKQLFTDARNKKFDLVYFWDSVVSAAKVSARLWRLAAVR